MSYQLQDGFYLKSNPGIMKVGNTLVTISYRFQKAAIDCYINDKDLNKCFPKSSVLNIKKQDDVLDYFFCSNEFSHLQICFRKSLLALIEHYGGFPSEKTEFVNFIISIESSYNVHVNYMLHNFENILLGVGIQNLICNDNSLQATISHELYHVISGYNHSEFEQMKKLIKFELAIKNHVSANKDKMMSWVSILEKLQYNKSIDESIVRSILSVFYRQDDSKIFWGCVVDTGVSVVAIDLNDKNFFAQELIDNKQLMQSLLVEITLINDIARNVVSSMRSYEEKDMLLKLLKLIAFISVYNSMPFTLMPFAIVKKPEGLMKKISTLFGNSEDYYKRAQEEIAFFEELVKSHIDKEPADEFFQFYNQYKMMIVDMNIYQKNSKDVEEKIHNATSIKSATEAYKTLNKGFLELFNQVLKAEEKLNYKIAA